MRIAYYITGHGFGHATRALTVMKALRKKKPYIQLLIRTTAPEAIFRREISWLFELAAVQTDTGGVEKNILFSDPEATIARAREFYSGADEIADREAGELRRLGADVVVLDVPPLAAEIAHRAGIPSVAIANFTWDRIYADYPDSGDVVARIRGYYAKVTLGLQTPLGHECDAFPRRENIPLIARKSNASREAVRRELGIDESDIAVLVALKGDELQGRALAATDPRIRFFAFARIDGPRVERLGDEWQPRFTDVLIASDVVLSKPGYGIVGECLANRRPLVHLPRHGFAETPYLYEAMEGVMPHRAIELEDLEPDRLAGPLLELAGDGFSYPEARIDGAGIAAERILAVAASGVSG
jgi:hypothetical protein